MLKTDVVRRVSKERLRVILIEEGHTTRLGGVPVCFDEHGPVTPTPKAGRAWFARGRPRRMRSAAKPTRSRKLVLSSTLFGLASRWPMRVVKKRARSSARPEAGVEALSRPGPSARGRRTDTTQRVLAVPPRRSERNVVTYLTDPEVDALLDACDQTAWTGWRDHAMFALTVQAGLRISELAGLRCQDVTLGAGANA